MNPPQPRIYRTRFLQEIYRLIGMPEKKLALAQPIIIVN